MEREVIYFGRYDLAARYKIKDCDISEIKSKTSKLINYLKDISLDY